ncbi:MAG: hypothetical protein IKD79_06330 [Oscillospiraceae bacterium]|nr:hypothetical protein [Oscillospiraceae bacterium]
MRVEAMTRADIERTVAKFAEAALAAKQTGFDSELIHGGHGWLLRSFLPPRTNHRTDEFGGSPENRGAVPPHGRGGGAPGGGTGIPAGSGLHVLLGPGPDIGAAPESVVRAAPIGARGHAGGAVLPAPALRPVGRKGVGIPGQGREK